MRINDPNSVLTERDLELVAFYASGFQLEEIGSMKFLSYHTVRVALSKAKERVGARNLTHLCVICVDYGVIQANGTGYKPVQAEGIR